ncbi:MAG: hypothetical protein QW568_00160 [Candidatus Anstonellaceae archaeon]
MVEDRRSEILAKGGMDIRVKRNGIYQLLPFKVIRKKTPLGEVPYLTLENKFLDVAELMRIAEECQLPVEASNGKVYPRGKKETDFAGL